MSHAHPAAPIRINPAAVTCAPGAGRRLFAALMFLGALCMVFTAILALGPDETTVKHAVAAYHIGFVYAVGLALGSLGLVMILHQVNAGWTATVRRQLENAARLIPFCAVLGLPVLAIELLNNGLLFEWMDPAVRANDHLAHHKSPFLNPTFFVVRAVVYFGIWSVFATALYSYSRRQDDTGERRLSVRARFISSFGLLLFALSTAFAGYDWLMSMDFHWFSTMWGVYFFAGNQLAATCLLVLTLIALRRAGKLEGLVTPEHFHDAGKLVLTFTVFWAYIGFSQYFLIWYSNIPEETAWYILRNSHGWRNVALFLTFGHFIVPFLLLLWRRTKRTPMLLGAVSLWLLFMHAVDLFFIVRPNLTTAAAYATSTGLERWWIDVAGFVGPVAVFLALYVRQVAANPLIPLKDPRLAEAIEHKNYV